MVAKPMKTLELNYPVIQILIMLIITKLSVPRNFNSVLHKENTYYLIIRLFPRDSLEVIVDEVIKKLLSTIALDIFKTPRMHHNSISHAKT